MKKGAREIKPGAIIYKQGGKLYMMEDNANEKASQGFRGNLEERYRGERHGQPAALCLRLDCAREAPACPPLFQS